MRTDQTEGLIMAKRKKQSNAKKRRAATARPKARKAAKAAKRTLTKAKAVLEMGPHRWRFAVPVGGLHHGSGCVASLERG